MKRSFLILIFSYMLVTFYFAVFNWEMFIVNLNISLGFGVIRIPLILIVFIVGLFTLLILWMVMKIFSLNFEKNITHKDEEINKLKAEYFDNQSDDRPEYFQEPRGTTW